MNTPFATKAASAVNDPRDSQQEINGVVNAVIETLIDGVRGYRAAADSASNELAPQFFGMSERRRMLAEDLIRISADDGLDPVTMDDSGTPAGVLHRTWMSLRTAVQGDAGVISAALNGEGYAAGEIERILNGGLPDAIASVARRALSEIESNIDQLEPLAG